MWLCFNDGFISAVKDWNDPTGHSLVVRARSKEDLQNIFPNQKIVESDDSDYQYRVFVKKDELAKIVLNRLMNIDYTNFKNSVQDEELHDMYTAFWWAGLRRPHSEL